MLPEELQHEAVIESRNRCEPKFDCYHVVLDEDKVSVAYRSQWKDDWEILFATVEEFEGEDRLRLTIIERYRDPFWRNIALGAAGGAVGWAYLAVGGWLVDLGVMGSTAQVIGGGVMVVALVACAALVAHTVKRDVAGKSDAARP